MTEEIIGKVSATDKNPSTINEFYFWTKAGYKLSPFDVIKVDHIVIVSAMLPLPFMGE